MCSKLIIWTLVISRAGFYKQEMCPPPKTSFLHPYTFHPDLSQSPRSTMSSSPLSFSSASFLHSPQPHTSSLPSPFQSCHHRSKGRGSCCLPPSVSISRFLHPHHTSPSHAPMVTSQILLGTTIPTWPLGFTGFPTPSRHRKTSLYFIYIKANIF